jgi:coenzyme PQQ synthesis protein D (PqqD)
MSGKLYVSRSRSVAARKLGDEMLIMSGRDSTLFTLDEVATILWEAADGGNPLDQIVDEKICREFDVERGEAMQDAEALVRGLADHGILQISHEPDGAPEVPGRVER